MANEVPNTTVTAPVVETKPIETMAPPIPVVPSAERTSVPASAVFSDEERKLAPTDTGAVVDGSGAIVSTKPAAAPVVPPVTPAEDKPVETPVETPVVPVTDAKVKIGDKEYTTKELEAALAKKDAPAVAPAPAPAKPVAAPVAPPTKEQIATAEAKWVGDFVKSEGQNYKLTTEEMETFLSGGEEAVKLLDTKLNDVTARAVMLARKSLFNDLNPALARIYEQMTPLVSNQNQLEAVAAEQQFLTAHPQFEKHMDVVKGIAQQLITQYPAQFNALTREQQIQEVAAQSDRVLQENFRRYNSEAPEGSTWKDKVKPATAVAAAKPVTPPAPLPPASNTPAAGTTAAPAKTWAASVAKDLTN